MVDGGKTNLQGQHQNAMGSFKGKLLFFVVGYKAVISLQHNLLLLFLFLCEDDLKTCLQMLS